MLTGTGSSKPTKYNLPSWPVKKMVETMPTASADLVDAGLAIIAHVS